MPTLVVDAGALLFSEPDIDGGLKLEQARITARGIIESYRHMGYEAVGIARRDLAAGHDFLHELVEQSSFSWLSANLVSKSDRQPLFTASTVLRKGDLNVGLTALTGVEGTPLPLSDANTVILPWKEVLPEVLDDLKSRCDIIILLSNLEEGQNRQISTAYPEIQIILQSGQRLSNLKPKIYNNTVILQTADQGKYLGEMEITWRSSGQWSKPDPDSLAVNKKRELDRLEWQLKSMLKKGEPEKVYKDRPAMLKRVHYLRERIETLTREIAELERIEDKVQKGAEWVNTFWALTADIADDRKVAALIEKVKEQKNKLARMVSVNRGLPGYSGSESCRECHETIFSAWSETPHARAWSTLKEEKEHYNIDCLPCHVTGLSPEDGVRALSLPAYLHNVGCESCHGPGKDHLINPVAANITRDPEAETCLTCHQEDQDPDFEMERDKLLVH